MTSKKRLACIPILDLAREQGPRFNLASFHETILSQGALPVALLRRMLLKHEGTIL